MTEKQKNILDVTWKVGLGLIGLVALWIGYRTARYCYQDNYGRSYWDDRSLSGSVVVHSFNDDRVRVWNKDTGRYTTPRLDWISGTPERDSLTVFCDKRGRRGFLSVNTGKIVIPAQYKKAWHFSEGLAAVMGDNGKIGFIDRDNLWVLGCEIPYEEDFDYIFKDGYCTVARQDTEGEEIYAVYDKTGAMVLPWGYTRVDEPNKEGYRVVCKDKEAWLYDRDFRPVFPDPYDEVELADDYAGVFLTRDHLKQLVDFKGTILEPFVIDSTYPLKYVTVYNEDEEDEYELVPEVAAYRVGLWEGLLDTRTGKAITPAKYWSFEMISKDLIEAKLESGDESVILNKRGMVVEQ